MWAIAFAAFFLLGAGWALAMPYDGPPDEQQHVTRAYGVVDGQIYAGGANMPVRAVQSLSLPATTACFRWKAAKPATCQATPGSDRAAERAPDLFASGASGYDPSYYLFVGPVIHHWPTMKGVITARLLTDAEISAFLAAAVAIAWTSARGRWMVGGILVAATPVTVNLMGAVNPAGVEIGAAVAFWAALLDLSAPERSRRWVVVIAAWSGAVLAVTRGFGVGWLAAALFVCALSCGRGKLRELWASVLVRRALAVIVVFSAAGVGWGLLAGANYHLTAATTSRSSLGQILVQEFWNRLPYYFDGTVRLTSYGDVPVPPVVGSVWLAFVSFFVLAGLVLGPVRTRIQILAIVAVGFGMLMSADVNSVRQGIWFSQGRYALPVLVGAPMIGALVLGGSGLLTSARNVGLLRWMAVALLPMQLIALCVTMIRFQAGMSGDAHLRVNPLAGRWQPVFGSSLPLLLFCAGLATWAVVAVRLPRTPTAEAPAVRPESRGGREPAAATASRRTPTGSPGSSC